MYLGKANTNVDNTYILKVMAKKTFQLISILIGFCLCTIVVLKIINKFSTFSYDSLDLIIFLIGVAFIFGIPKFLSEATSLKFMDFEWKKEIQKVTKDLRLYTILNENGDILKNTFPVGEIKIERFQDEGDEIDIWFKQKPIYFEIRRTNKQVAYKVDSVNHESGTLFKCKANVSMRSSIGNESIANGYIIEAYII